VVKGVNRKKGITISRGYRYTFHQSFQRLTFNLLSMISGVYISGLPFITITMSYKNINGFKGLKT